MQIVRLFMLFLTFIIIPIINSLSSIKPKLCINCEFFKPNYLTGNKFGKCIAFPTSEDKDTDSFLVDGIKIKKEKEYHYCSIARKDEKKCGKEGKNYVEKREN